MPELPLFLNGGKFGIHLSAQCQDLTLRTRGGTYTSQNQHNVSWTTTFAQQVACWIESFDQNTKRGLMSGKKSASRERQPPLDEQGSSDVQFAPELRSSPLHLTVSQPPGGAVPRRGSPPGELTARQSMGRSQVSPIHAQGYPHVHHIRQQQYAMGGLQPSTGHSVTTVTPDSRGLFPHEMMSPPIRASRRRSGGSTSTMSVSPSKRTRIGELDDT